MIINPYIFIPLTEMDGKLLDGAVSDLYGAYGVTLLKSDYAGAAIRVKDNSNVEEDISFDAGGNLDIAALSGSAPYRVITFYDQSGNNNHKSAASGAEPLLNTSEVAFRIDFAASWRRILFGDLSAFSAGEIFIKRKIDEDPTTGGAGGGGSMYEFGTASDRYIPHPAGFIYDDFGTNVRKDTGVNPTDSMENYHVYSAYSAPSDWACYLNDGLTELWQTSTNTVSFSSNAVFGATALATAGMLGYLKSIVLFSEKVTSDERVNIHDNL